MTRSSLLSRLWLVFAFVLPSQVAAQVEIANIPLIYDTPKHLGQAQGNRVCLSKDDTGGGHVLAPLGGGGASGTIPGVGTASWLSETTDGFVVQSNMSSIVKRTKLGGFVTSVDYNPFLVSVGPIVPLPGGQVMVALSLSLKTFDGALTEIGSFPTAVRGDGAATVVGLARRIDGVLFTSERTPTGNHRLTAYGSAGGVIWDVAIPASGPIALAGGKIYLARGTSSLDVYSMNGAALGPWTGPAGSPLSNVIDVSSTTAGDVLFTLTGRAGGPLRAFSVPPVATVRKSWGEVKAAFR